MGQKVGAGTRLQETSRSSEEGLKSFLDRHGLAADKRLGQHFLNSQSVIKKILNCASGAQGVLEIGPGPGILTKRLSEDYETIAVELDRRMASALSESSPKAKIVFSDVLKIDLALLIETLPSPVCVVSNMPYNITGPLLAKITDQRFRNAVLMMQREVGEKILAEPGDSQRGALSVFIQLGFDVKKICIVPGGAFSPPPKVDSIVLDLWPRPKVSNMESVVNIIRHGFSQPRKTLVNNLGELFEKSQVQTALSMLSLQHKIRPHEMTNDQWIKLAESL